MRRGVRNTKSQNDNDVTKNKDKQCSYLLTSEAKTKI